ncbi:MULTISPECIES: acetyl-CoA carboxylase biotin carboxyl carrier protein [Psychrobacter]|uniref:Biotin carboxyl carrier protein of acetyl-CoA carboxylase n=1 Tax=Psychrobacter alimentarius TaxID=261164 RepID=A0ABN4N1L4_9GAMM|nr:MULTISPECIES: acetyl-CoA carboxylase biotin carboxyl carrier protein [Psychrobacter]AMT96868.1 Biotin carboxyl carrier protein of acetyl-CoA carboxylase [Psychrobacter alimentarius]QCB30772.1 acetyl-CoA carboxylase biotin carboxyl carrier protein [Psychrobacter sp. PAMC27889]
MNINFTDLEKLIKLAEGSDIKSLELTDGDTRISIVCQADDNHNDNSSTRNSTSKVSTSEQQTASVSAQKTITNNETISSDTTDETVATENAENNVTAPMLGTFYLRPEPTAEPFFKVGDQIEAGQTLCIIEAMKMMYEVKAETSGTLKEILVEEGDVVEYEQPLFMIAPNS